MVVYQKYSSMSPNKKIKKYEPKARKIHFKVGAHTSLESICNDVSYVNMENWIFLLEAHA